MAAEKRELWSSFQHGTLKFIMKHFFYNLLVNRLWLVAVGVALGYLARYVLGAPEDVSNQMFEHKFYQPMVQPNETDEDEVIDLPLIRLSR